MKVIHDAEAVRAWAIEALTLEGKTTEEAAALVDPNIVDGCAVAMAAITAEETARGRLFEVQIAEVISNVRAEVDTWAEGLG